MGLNEMLAAARESVPEVDASEAASLQANGAVMLDVREPNETAQGVIPGGLLLPRGLLETSIGSSAPDLNVPIVINCASGVRSLLAAVTLQGLGYANVVSLAGGFAEWKSSGQLWETPSSDSEGRLARYAKHLLLPEVGTAGQERLLESKVLLIGAGGLGSPAALYLAAAGVGTIGLADMDTVDVTNLQRQIIHDSLRVGWSKVDSARHTISALNPDVNVMTHEVRVDASNAADLMRQYDVVIDGGDNFDVRYALSDASVETGIPVVYGSVFRFEGQVTVFDPAQGYTYRGFMPESPPAAVAPNCSTAGVLGVLPGIVGTIQAAETLKMLLGIGESLVGRMLIIDALEMDFTELRLPLQGESSRRVP